MKKIAILQSNYIPWKGYFDIIANVDVFVFLDDVQYTKNDWRNRNMIKTAKGAEWLTIPIRMTGKFGQRISETEVTDHRWVSKHLSTVRQNYSKSAYFSTFIPELEKAYQSISEFKSISQINQTLIQFLCNQFGIKTKLTNSTDYFSLDELTAFSSNERIIEICKKEDASFYLSGSAAKSYIDRDLFKSNGIQLAWTDYSNYPEYRQLYGAFVHAVSAIDLLFNEGPQAMKFLKGPTLAIADDSTK